MSKKNLRKQAGEGSRSASDEIGAQVKESLELTVNKATNEIIFKDPSGKVFVIQPQIIEPEPRQEDRNEPLSADEFRDALDKLVDLGITWSPDIPPVPIVADVAKWTESARKEYSDIQKKYPRFPRELGGVILHELLGHPQPVGLVGPKRELDQKRKLIASLLTQEYRSEFFFKFAIKLPYLEQLDWEVVVKAYERGVDKMPRVAYALLQIAMRGPLDTTQSIERGANSDRTLQVVTVAVNERLIDKLMNELALVKKQLEKAQRSAGSLTEPSLPEENANEPST